MRPVDDSSTGSRDLAGKPLAIKAHREGDSITLALLGELDLSTVQRLDAAIQRAEEEEVERIVLDLSELSFLDSTGLSLLLKTSVRHREDGNRLSFIPSKHEAVRGLIELTKSSEMFERAP